jgi:hypothetical protein
LENSALPTICGCAEVPIVNDFWQGKGVRGRHCKVLVCAGGTAKAAQAGQHWLYGFTASRLYGFTASRRRLFAWVQLGPGI